MSRFFFKWVLLPLSKWPLERLYRIAPVLRFLLHDLVRYRRSVVRMQLKKSFPDASPETLKEYENGFHAHLTDLILEIIKGFSISREEAVARCKVTNPELFEAMRVKGKNLILVGGHYNNWEMLALALPSQIPYEVKGIYKPLRNTFYNTVMKESREKYGLTLFTKSEFKSYIKDPGSKPQAIIFGADQSPTYSKNVYWMQFLNQKTPVAFGTEHYAREYDLAVLYGKITKVRRGYYSLTFSLITDTPATATYGSVTEAHTRILEASILENPRFWIWTHKRWKRR